jgi:nitrous oxidase accessory protein
MSSFLISSTLFKVDASYLAQVLQKAKDGDKIILQGGVYKGNVVVDKNVYIDGQKISVVDGGGSGHVIYIKSPCTIKNLIIKNSGRDVLHEDSGIMVENTTGVYLEGNRIENTLFGIYLKNSEDIIIRDNIILGNEKEPFQFRGDGIRLWYSRKVLIEKNYVENMRDVVIWYSNDVRVIGNHVINSRYGLHYMYSDGNILEGNEFYGNVVGAFLMFSKQILIRKNVFGSSKYLTGIGVGFKDASYIVLTENLIIDNSVGIYLANSPEFRGGSISEDIQEDDILSKKKFGNIIKRNVFAFNIVAVRVLPPSFPNLISDNTFVGNLFIAEFEQVLQDRNFWYSNFFDIYRGYDKDKDGYGDFPFEYSSLFLEVIAKKPELSFIYFSPLKTVIDIISRVLPIFNPPPVFSDARPRMKADFFGWDRKERKIKPKLINRIRENIDIFAH